MGIKITKEYSCDCCGKEFQSERDYRKHTRRIDSYNLGIFAVRFHSAKTKEEKLEELADIFDINNSVENSRLSFYDDEVVDCLIYGFNNGHYVQNQDATDDRSTWYLKDEEIAKFIEENRANLKRMYNDLINRTIQAEDDEHRDRIQRLQGKLLNIE
jgi:hypothetical protein